MGSLRSRGLGSSIGAGVLVCASLIGCTTSEPAQAAVEPDIGLDRENAATPAGASAPGRPIVGLYRSVAELTPVAPTTDTLPTAPTGTPAQIYVG